METLHQIASLAQSEASLQEKLDMCVSRIAACYRTPRCSILRTHNGSRTARILSSSDPLAEEKRDLALERYPEVRWVVRNMRSLVIEEAHQNPVLSGIALGNRVLLRASLIVVPLLSTRLEGVLLLRVPSEEKKFTEADLLFFETAASLLAGILAGPASGPAVRESSREPTEEVAIDGPAAGNCWFGRLLGRSPVLQDVYRTVERVAESDAPVLIQGESGTGKELIAREIHDRSSRSGNEFVAVNCSALPEHLLESLLFGHRKGTFTGATGDRPGLLEAADGGTLFLDEVGELPAPIQAKLLRVLETGEYLVLGDNRPRKTDLRILSATNGDLPRLVVEGSFRDDLLYRLRVITLSLPPLREREGDVNLLLNHFLYREGLTSGRVVLGVRKDAHRALLAYPWPGNVRELLNVVRRAVLLSPGPVIRKADLPEEIRAPEVAAEIPDTAFELPYSLSRDRVLRRFDTNYVRHALHRTAGNVSQAARIAGVRRQYFYDLMERTGVSPDEFRDRGSEPTA